MKKENLSFIALAKTIFAFACSFVALTLSAQNEIPSWVQERFKEFQDKYTVSGYLNPPFLEANFSGNKKPDVALLIERKIDKKKGMIIFFTESKKSFFLGAGTRFGDGGDDFSWAGKWEIYDHEVAHETTFDDHGDVLGSQEFILLRPAINIRESGGTGGLIYFNGKRFIWIHQGD